MVTKCVVFSLAMVMATVSGRAAEPAPKMPTEIALNSGFTLRQIQVVRWEPGRVVVRHSGGTTPVAFSDMTPASRAVVEAVRAELDKPRKFTGSAFITTAGAGSYKLTSMVIVLLPGPKQAVKEPAGGFNERNIPPGAKIVRTDGEGKFEFVWDNGPMFTLYASDSRRVGAKTEFYTWHIERTQLGDPDGVILSNHNHL